MRVAAFAIGPDMQVIWRTSGRMLPPASVEIMYQTMVLP